MLSLMMVFLFIGNLYALPVSEEDTVKLTRSTSLQGHYVWENVTKGNTFASFCLETNEDMVYGGSYYVYDVSDSAFNGGAGGLLVDGGDPLSDQTRWLYTEFLNGNFAQNAFTMNDFQDAFWYLEGEIASLYGGGPAFSLVYGAEQAMLNGTIEDYNFADIGVMNIRDCNGVLRQSQLVGTVAPVPEPATMTLFGLGLVGLGCYRKFK